jgi:hypothetical protein
MVKDIEQGTGFGYSPAVHHDNPVGDASHGTQVMGDKQDGHIPLLLQVSENIQNLSLDGGVESGGRLIGYKNFGVTG